MGLGVIIKNRIFDPLNTMFTEIGHGQIKLGITRFFASVFRGSKFGISLNQKIHSIIITQLENELSYVLDRFRNYSCECKYDKNAPVWVCWLQGYDNAPEIVKRCINSIKTSTTHPVNIVTSENLLSFCDFPDYIMSKYSKGIITNAQFSDILRMTLLSEYGGLWIDATIFIPKELPEEVFNYQFYTCKRKPINGGYVSNYKWTSFLNGCQKSCVIQKAVKDLFYEYWNINDYLIDYLLVDYFMILVYRNIPNARNLIDDLPYNNPQIEELQSRMSLPYDEIEYKHLINDSDTDFFKLSWRMNFDRETSDNKMTYYGWFLKNN